MRVLIFLLVLVFAACSKLDIEPDNLGDPVFYISGEVDGESVHITAGQDGYYQSTGFYANTIGQLELSGKLSVPGCTNDCFPGLEIILKDEAQASAFAIEDTFKPGTRSFFTKWESPEEVMLVRLFSMPTGTAPFQYEWDLGNNSIVTRANPHVSFSQMGSREVSLRVTDATGCISSQTREIGPGDGTGECSILLTPPVVCATDSAGGPPLYCVKAIATGGQPPYTFTYDNQTYTGNIIEIQLDEFPAENLCVQVEDTNGITSTTCANYSLSTSSPSGTQSCNTQFTYQSELTDLPYDSLQVGSVEIIWTDSKGKSFYSSLSNNQGSATFSILEASPYLPNENGQSTSTLKLAFSAKLTAMDGTVVEMKNVSGIFGFAHP